MTQISEEQQRKIVAALEKAGARLPCPRCANNNFTLLDGYFNQTVQPELGTGFVLGGTTVPSVVVVCTRCGYLSQHALGALGLLPKPVVEGAKK